MSLRERVRHYGKWILPILGVGLMLLWLKNPGNQNTGAQNIQVGTLDGKKVMSDDLKNARNYVTILDSLAKNISSYYAYQLAMMQARELQMRGQTPDLKVLIEQVRDIAMERAREEVMGFNSTNPNLQMFLLLKEAEKNNLKATDEEISRDLGSYAGGSDKINDLVRNLHQTEIALRDAIKASILVRKLNAMAMTAIQPSIPELQHLADRIYSQVSVRYVALDAAIPASKISEPNEDQIAEHFNLYKGVLPLQAHTNPPSIQGRTFPFGYKVPDQAKVEYLTFDRKAIRDSIKPTREDYMKAQEYYDANPAKFRKLKTPTMGPTTTQAAAEPELRPFDEVKEQLVQAQIDARAEKLVDQIVAGVIKQLAEPWTVTPDGYKALAPGKSAVSYETVMAKVQKDNNYLPRYTSPGAFRDQESLFRLIGIGNAWRPGAEGRREGDFPTLALNVRELNDDSNRAGYLRELQQNVEGPVLIDAAGNRYIYRVVEVSKAHEPKLADVKDQVIADWKHLKTFEQYIRTAENMVNDADKSDLITAASARQLLVQTTPPFTQEDAHLIKQPVEGELGIVDLPTAPPQPTTIQGIGTVPLFTQAAFALAAAHGPTTPAQTSPATGTAPATTTAAPRTVASTTSAPASTAAGKTAYVAIERRLTVYVMELATYEPIPENVFRNPYVRRQLMTLAAQRSFDVFGPKWNTLEAIAARMKYVPLHGSLEKEL